MNKSRPVFTALFAALTATLLVAATGSAPSSAQNSSTAYFGQTVTLAELSGEIGRYQWPSGYPVRVSRPFNPPSSPWGSGHRGVDLDIPTGSEVYSTREGTVFFVGTIAGTPALSIKHSALIRTTYTPVKSDLTVGSPVSAGQKIGILQAGHPGLHFGAKIDDRHYINPLLLILGPVRLLPTS